MTIRARGCAALLSVCAALTILGVVPVAEAAFPGMNGKIVFERGSRIWIIGSRWLEPGPPHQRAGSGP